MKKLDVFAGYHPLVNMLYFAMVLVFTMFLMHPVCLVISLTGALAYRATLEGKAMWKQLRFILPVLLMAAVVNPILNHEGATILTYLPTGNPLTLESIVYGFAAAVMLASAMLWFSCYSAVMSSDKFVYLFGRVIPALSLVLSMALRFVPRFIGQFRVVADAQKCLGRDMAEGSLVQRLKRAITVFSIMVTWSLENAIETADSMRSRGYGLPGRTAFSNYRFDDRDRSAMLWLLFCGLYLGAGWAAGGLAWRYYPTLKGGEVLPITVSFQLVYLALCLTPVILNRWEDRKWKHLQSEI